MFAKRSACTRFTFRKQCSFSCKIGIIVFLKENPEPISSLCVFQAAEHVYGMQNQNEGWAAFESENNKLFLNKISCSNMDTLCDPSTPNVTGRVLEAFGLTIHSNHEIALLQSYLSVSTWRVKMPSYILRPRKSRQALGGFAKVRITCLAPAMYCVVFAYFTEGDILIPESVGSAIRWLRSVQNSDGGWGE